MLAEKTEKNIKFVRIVLKRKAVSLSVTSVLHLFHIEVAYQVVTISPERSISIKC